MTETATLREPASRVSPRAPVVWGLGAIARGLFLGTALFVASRFAGVFAMPTWGWVVYAAAAIGYAAVMPIYRYQVHRWESTDTAVYIQRGWLTRERRIAP